MKTLSWDKIQQGDEEAFRQLYEQYADLLYGYGMKIAGDETLVTEAVQSLFVYIFEKKRNLHGPSIHTRLLMCFVETHDSERTEKKRIVAH